MIRLCATGDSILLGPIPAEYESVGRSLKEFITRADVRIANMETTLTHFDCYASTFCGGTWLSASPDVLYELDRFGFQYYSFANNHSMDYSYGGVESTIRALKDHGCAFSGSGMNLEEATRHGAVRTDKGSFGFIAVTTTLDDTGRAGDAQGPIPGRPGVNMLRHKEIFSVNAEHMEALRQIAAATKINGRRDNSKKGGYTLDTPGIFNLGTLNFRLDSQEGKFTVPNSADSERNLEAIRTACRDTDYVVICLHSHEIPGLTDDEPDYFVKTFSRSCIEAGAAAVICSGTHQIKAVEIYRGKPIFYSIANFIFQSDHVEYLPADYYEKYSVPREYDACEALAVRSDHGKRGLQTDFNNYMGLVPMLTFDDNELTELVIQPTELCFSEGKGLKGLPRKADPETFDRIFERLCQLSKPYGTIFTAENGLIRVRLEDDHLYL